MVSPIKYFGISLSPVVYMQVSGVFELICGTMLATGTLNAQRKSCIHLMLMMLLTSYCQLVLGDLNGVSYAFRFIFFL